MVLEAVEPHLRPAEILDDSRVVVRGWPLTVEGILRNAEATRSRFSWRGEPLVAISAELTGAGWDLDRILSGPRLRTRSRYATVPALTLVETGFVLLPTFAPPHYSVVLPAYDGTSAERLLEALGDVQRNPYFDGR